ncbi:MAG: hypothetical protein R2761_15955 [Acidimicrobiales bacterium]
MDHRPTSRRRLAVAALVLAAGLGAAAPPAGADRGHRHDGYDLPEAGILLEGIGYDRRAGVIYVSGVNDGGRIYRAEVGSGALDVWQPGNTDGRTTARGIDVDRDGRVFVAGGPSGRAFVYARSGELLAALEAPAGTFFNDVWVGRDGSTYVTNSNQPQIWRISEAAGVWSLDLWLDAADQIPVVVGAGQFNLGGIVATPDGRYLLVAQGNSGRLWRVTVATREVVEVDLGGTALTNADGIVLAGRTLWVVQNFSRQVTEVALRDGFASGRIKEVTPTPADRTFTTAKLVRGQLLAVDSQFGLPQPSPADDRVIPVDR